MRPTRIGIVGAGLVGRRHLAILLADPAFEAAGIVDPAPEARSLAREAGVPLFADVTQLVDEGRSDGVVVATPNRLHGAAALPLIDRAVPVLVEKPVADTLTEAFAIAEAAERRGVPILVGHHRRHNPIVRRAAELVAEGAVGRVTAVTCAWLARKPAPYFAPEWRRRKGAGPVLVNAIHDIDALRMMCGEIESVQAVCGTGAREDSEVEDTAAATLRFANGALGTLIVSDAVPSPVSWEWTSRENPDFPHEPGAATFIGGSRGTLAVPSLELWSQTDGTGWTDPLTRERIYVRPGESYVNQLHHFADVIAGRAAPVIDAREGARTLAATLAIHASADCGAAVRIDDLVSEATAQGPRIEAAAG